MVKHLFIFITASAALLRAADYFPVQTGNTWSFSYINLSMSIVPNPPITKDSGTVKWDIFENRNVEMVNVYSVKQTRCLIRRTKTRSDTSLYDSIYSPPLTTIDTVLLTERIDQVGIGFSTATCAFAVHDPATAMPAELSSKDTAVTFQGASIDCKKMIVKECSCLKKQYSYSFTLGPSIGPIEAYISTCPNLTGFSFKETWKCTGREYPTPALHGTTPRAARTPVIVSRTSGRIACSIDLDHPSPVHIELLDLEGRLIRTLLQGKINAGIYRSSWGIPQKACGIALLRVRTGNEDRCVRVITGAR
jgi:hypothetical protein